MSKCSNGFCEFDSHTTTNIKYKIMTKNELKELWWGLPHKEKKKEMKLIVISFEYKMVKVITDVEGYYQSSSHFPKNDLTEFALNLKNHTRFSDYNIVCM